MHAYARIYAHTYMLKHRPYTYTTIYTVHTCMRAYTHAHVHCIFIGIRGATYTYKRADRGLYTQDAAERTRAVERAFRAIIHFEYYYE